jgi:O-Antigen ligase
MSRWAFRFLLFYIVIMCVQPQNRFLFLHPLRIANLSFILAVIMHFMSLKEDDRPFIRLGPGTITAMALIIFSTISLFAGSMQTSSAWNTNNDLILKNAICLIMIEAMATTVQRVWAVQATLFFSVLWWIKGGLRLAASGATYQGDRLGGPSVSLIENPNGFAYLMTMMIPCYLYFFQQAKNKYIRWGCLAAALAGVYIVLQTGSRTGVIALVSVGVFLLPKYGSKHKLALTMSIAVIFIISTSVGAMNVERFKTIPLQIKEFFAEDKIEKDPSQMSMDEQSAWERKMKNKHTWALIKDNLVFGVGVNASEALMAEKFEHSAGQVHNEILYAGRQMGLIGMGIYVSFIVTLIYCGHRSQQAMKYLWPAAADLGWTLKMQGVVIITGGFFSPIPWNPISLILVGSASALWTNIKMQQYK